MKKYLTVAFILVSLISFANKGLELTPQVWLISSEKNEELNKNESQYIFEFNNLESNNYITIQYSIDNQNKEAKLNTSMKLSLNTTPGAHNFQFYLNDQYFEIYADSLVTLPQYTNTYQVRFESSEFPITVDKPVIYLYPERETNFSMEVNPTGELSFTYPNYNNGWNGTALPNGEININHETFNYLFWESNQQVNLNLIDLKKGTIVKGKESLDFLSKQLDAFGFTSKEKADFVTFWAPQLQRNEFNYINFVLNNDADIFAKLSITPAPDNIYRFYMLTSKIENPNDFYYLEPQLIESIDRKGFTVLEWGGSKIDINLEKLNHCRL